MNEAIATVGSNALVLDTQKEDTLGKQATAMERQVAALVVDSDLGYSAAGEMLKKLKGVQKKVKDYWEPLRKSAKEAYDKVNDKKKEMLGPLESAERILKNKMAAYAVEQERKQQEAAERQRAEARAEADRLLADAIQADASGDHDTVEAAVTFAEVYDDVAMTASAAAPKKPKVAGISLTKTWKIKSIDSAKVPVSINGTEIRPVDTAAVMRLIKESKGQISIPGIEFVEDYSVGAQA